ncbi:MAG: DNA repair protein RadA [Bacillota bacterium]|nr:MAG: DNA repair protein RadA [Bacillota bacterium]
MAKTTTTYVCGECGTVSPKWLGKCPSCGAWNTFVEETVAPQAQTREKTARYERPRPLSEVTEERFRRIKSGSEELDRVLGGGIVPASMVLLGGDPGIGKSTLLTEVAGALSKERKVLYVSAEESVSQLKLRCNRLGVHSETLLVMNETSLENIENCLDGVDVLVVDSIQAVYLESMSSSAGSVGQVRECASRLMRLAKANNVTVFLVGHVTKEGALAGPKVLEHIMDTVLYFEGDAENNYRILRAVKNRFGSVNEVGVFEMRESGLVGVKDYSGIFMSLSRGENAGSVVTPFFSGNRSVLVEVQGLVSKTVFGMPRRMSLGIDYNKMVLMLAVLEKKAGLPFYSQDVYLNAMGGIKLSEPAVDLAVLLSLASAYTGVPVDAATACFGEVGLTGEVRGVSHAEARVRECVNAGFKRVILPRSNLRSVEGFKDKISFVPVGYVSQAVKEIVKNKPKGAEE